MKDRAGLVYIKKLTLYIYTTNCYKELRIGILTKNKYAQSLKVDL